MPVGLLVLRRPFLLFAARLSFFSSFLAFFSCVAVPATAVRIDAMSSSSSRWAYQMSIVPICANEAIASRYARTDASVTSLCPPWRTRCYGPRW